MHTSQGASEGNVDPVFGCGERGTATISKSYLGYRRVPPEISPRTGKDAPCRSVNAVVKD